MSRPLVAVAAVIFAIAGLAPIAMMAGRLEFADLAAVFDARTLALLERTFRLGLGAAAIAFAIGLPFGFLVSRTDLPGAGLWRGLGVLPLLLPPLVLAMSWAAMTTLRGGFATTLVLALSTFPLVSLYAQRAFERIDARREEAALLAGGLRAVCRMELPLVLPSALIGACFAFVFAINDFAVPDYVSSIGAKYNVYADEIFASWRSDQDTSRAVAAALPLVALTLLALWPLVALRRRNPLSSFDGDFRRPSALRLGRWKAPAMVFVLGVLAVAALLPLGRLVWESGGGAKGFSLAHMQDAFGRAIELGRSNLQSSLLYSVCAAIACIPLGIVLGHALERSAVVARIGLPLVILPIAVPAILFGIGCIATWNRDATAAVYDSGTMVVLLMVGRFAAFAVLAFAAATAMLDPRIEEAARMSGVGPLRRLLWITAPALGPAIAGSVALVFVLSMRELDSAILVPAANGMILFRLYNAVHFGRDDFVAALALLVVAFVVLPGLLWSLWGRGKLELLP